MPSQSCGSTTSRGYSLDTGARLLSVPLSANGAVMLRLVEVVVGNVDDGETSFHQALMDLLSNGAEARSWLAAKHEEVSPVISAIELAFLFGHGEAFCLVETAARD